VDLTSKIRHSAHVWLARRADSVPVMVAQHRELVSAIPGPRSAALHERRMRAVSAGVGAGLPIYVDEASGAILRDVDGNQLIDFASGIAVTSVGNSDPRVVARVREQVERFTHTCFMVTSYEPYVAVCERLNELTPGSHDKRSALFNSGAEAVENAVKIARYATGRDAVVAFDHAYHGRTNLTMALTAKSMPYKSGFGPFAGEVYRVPMAYPYRWPTGPERCSEEAFAAFVELVHTQVGELNTAAVLLEPIQGEGGFIEPAPGFVARVADWCREHGIVFIADEVQTGFARTGAMFACEHEGIDPDLIVTAKGIADFYRVDDANVSASTLTNGVTNPGWMKLSNSTEGTPGFGSYNYCGGQCSYDMPVYSPPGAPYQSIS